MNDSSSKIPFKPKKRLEFSKWVWIIALIQNTVVIAVAVYMILTTRDTSVLIYLIPSTAAEFGVGTAFYYNKAKLENRIKLMAAYGLQPSEDAFREYN